MNIYLTLHLITIVPVLILGPFILFRPKGNRIHVLHGRVWSMLMVISCLFTFGITSEGRYNWLHGLAVFTILSVVLGVRAVKRKDIRGHQGNMIGSYLGALFAFVWAASSSNRLINTWILGLLN